MTTIEGASAKYTENSFKAFLDGKAGCDEKWVGSIARASEQEDIIRAIERLEYHSNKESLEFLRQFTK